MLKKTLTVVACALLCGAVLAQQAALIGKSAEVKGLVTVSDGSTVRSVLDGAPVVDGTRYVTSSNGTVLLRMDNGCDVRLQPNQALVVRDKDDCPALWAAIQNVGDKAVAGFLGGGAGLALLGATAATAALLRSGNNGSPPPI
uniref:hypothetical protein n=1 Tax=Ramlibacter sp. TaxID=1917967 RepID=UPI00185D202D